MDERILHDLQRAGFYHAPASRHARLAESVARAPLLPWRHAALHDCTALAEALKALGQAFRFPDWYGENLDALYDCLTDPDWEGESGLVLLISGLETLRQRDPEGFSQLVEVLHTVAEARADAGLPCWILLDTPARGVPKLPIA